MQPAKCKNEHVCSCHARSSAPFRCDLSVTFQVSALPEFVKKAQRQRGAKAWCIKNRGVPGSQVPLVICDRLRRSEQPLSASFTNLPQNREGCSAVCDANKRICVSPSVTLNAPFVIDIGILFMRVALDFFGAETIGIQAGERPYRRPTNDWRCIV